MKIKKVSEKPKTVNEPDSTKEGIMKKIVLIVMLLLSPTLCLAQAEINGSFSLEDSIWDFLTAPGYSLGFYGGTIYLCEYGYCLPMPNSHISDMIVISLFSSNLGGGYSIGGLASPLIGVGTCRVCAFYTCASGTIVKTGNSFYSSSLAFDNGQSEEVHEMLDGILPLIAEEVE